MLSNFLGLKNSSIISCDDKKVLESLSYQEVLKISEILTNMLSKVINNKNICIGLLMNHNIYIPSIIMSISNLNNAFVFLTSKVSTETVINLQLSWILSLECTKEISLFHEINRIPLGKTSLIVWNRCNISANISFENIFCVVQTSGTTGDNKLIRVTNECIQTNASSLRKIFDIKSEDIIFWGTNLTFDPSIIELLLALHTGASLLIVPYKVSINPKSLCDALFKIGNITFLQMVPSLFLRWNEDQIQRIMLQSQLRILAFGGEHFPNTILAYERRNDLRVFNLYGISEVSCWATYHEVTNENQNNEIHIGKCLEETYVELRNQFGEVINQGKGEVFIGSSSRICYINEESASEVQGAVFRETGDVAEAKEEGIFLVGRKNRIIKRFGQRINLTKMEKKIYEEIGLANSCIWCQENKKILTFLLMKNFDVNIKSKILDKLRVKLINTLSKESFPDFIDIVTNFPLTCHGKINEKALIKLYPTSEITMDFKDTFSLLWCKYSGMSTENLEEIKQYTFFEMGGNSISATQLLTEFRELIHSDYPSELVAMIFEGTFNECMKLLEDFKPIKQTKYSKIFHELPTKRRKIEDLDILWLYDMRACVDGSPLIFVKENEVYVAIGSFSHKFVVFRENGEVIYEITLPECIESTPVISLYESFILVGCYNGVMYCLDFIKKNIVWEYATGEKIKSSALICRKGTAVIFGSYDKTVYCVSVLEGSKLWHTTLDGSIYSNPVYNEFEKNVYIATTKATCFCLAEDDGQVLWKYNCGGPIFGTPCLVNSNKNIVFPAVQGVIHCLDILNGNFLWKYQTDGHVFSSIVSLESHILFGCHDGTVTILNISRTCTLVKKIVIGSEISTTPFVGNINGKDLIITACNSGLLSVIDFNTFEVVTTVQLPGQVFSSPLVNNSKVYVGCRDNNFYCIKLNT